MPPPPARPAHPTPPTTTADQIAQDLLRQIGQAKSPLARLRVLARAWHNVRHLSPTDRIAVAARIGLENADDLVAAIAGHQGKEPPPEILEMLDQAQHADGATVRALAEKVRDPHRRGELAGDGLRALGSALAGPDPVPAPAPAPPAPPVPVTPPAPAPVAAPAPIVTPPAVSWPLRQAMPAPPAPPAVPPPAPAVVLPEIVPEPAPPLRVPDPAPAPPTTPAGSVALAAHLAGMPGLTARFRRLRHGLEEARRLRPEELREVLRAFPEGWARRRALSELIEAGLPARTADVLALIEDLPAKDRPWCLGRLAQRRLSPEEKEGVLGAATTPTARRRLAVRLGEE
jgi:hypothetical protein